VDDELWDPKAPLAGAVEGQVPAFPALSVTREAAERVQALTHLVSLTFRSRTGRSHPHVVTRIEGTDDVRCTCVAMLSIDIRPAGCWAMQWSRHLWGLPPR
jgi:hypothetical protein